MPNKIQVSCHEETPHAGWMDVVASFIEKVLAHLDIDQWELSVLFCLDPYIAELNKQYRNIDGPTDILSFEQGDEYVDDSDETWFSAGDLVVSLDSLASNAERFSVSRDEELKRLLIHGILHLDGLDHATNDPEEEMLLLQEKILDNFSDIQVIKE